MPVKTRTRGKLATPTWPASRRARARCPAGERMLVIACGAVVVAWAGWLVLLAGPVMGVSPSAGAVWAGWLYALAMMAGLLGATGRLLARRSELARSVLDRADARQVQLLLRLTGGAAVLAAVGGAGSTLLIHSAPAGMEVAGVPVGLSPVGQAIGGFLLMLPLAAGAAALLLAGSLLRTAAGPDAFAPMVRDLLLSVAAGAATLAVTWRAGMDLVGLSAGAGVVLAALGGALALCRPSGGARGRIDSVRTNRLLGLSFASTLPWAGLVLLLTVQLRVAGDLLGIGWAGKAGWIALSAGLLALLLRRAERWEKIGRSEAAGAAVGCATAGILQVTVLALGAGSTGRMALCAVGPALAQIPILALVAVLVTRNARQYVSAGGGLHTYLATKPLDLAAGALVLPLVLSLPFGFGAWVLLSMAGLFLLVGLACGVAAADGVKRRVAWVILGGGLVGLLALGTITGHRHLCSNLGDIGIGRWLTVHLPADTRQAQALPVRPRVEHAGVSAAVDNILQARPGEWWTVSTAGPAMDAPRTCRCDWSALAPTAANAVGPDLFGIPFLAELWWRPGRYDGVLLDLLPADHPDAWRVLNVQTLGRAAARVHAGGQLVLRTQASWDATGRLLTVARTFLEVAGDGWAVLGPTSEGVDMLLTAPATDDPPAAGQHASVVDLRLLCRTWPVAATTLHRTQGSAPVGPRREVLTRWLQAAGR